MKLINPELIFGICLKNNKPLNCEIVPSIVILPIKGTVPSGLEAFRFK
jgi:hypothetical protein